MMDVQLRNVLKLPYFKLEVVFSKVQSNPQVQHLVVLVCAELYKQTGGFLIMMKFEILIIVLFNRCNFLVFISTLTFLFMMSIAVPGVLGKTGQRNCLDIVRFWSGGQSGLEGQQPRYVLHWQHKSLLNLRRTWSIFSFSVNKKNYSIIVFWWG